MSYELTRKSLNGIWPALIVPWTENDEVDPLRLAQEVRVYAAAGVHGVYTGGTTGEFYAQDDEAFATITRTVCATAHKQSLPCQIGCTALSNRTVAKRIRIAREHGADGIQVAIPFWLELKDDEVRSFFECCVREAGEIPIILYNTGRAKRKVPAPLLGALYRDFPTFIGMKDTVCTVDDLNAVLEESPDLAVFGGEKDLMPKMRAGGRGCYSAFCGLNADLVLNLYKHSLAGEWEAAGKYQALMNKVFEGLGPILEAGLMDSAIDRVLRVLGGGDVGRICQGPYRSATDELVEGFSCWCKENASEWLPARV